MSLSSSTLREEGSGLYKPSIIIRLVSFLSPLTSILICLLFLGDVSPFGETVDARISKSLSSYSLSSDFTSSTFMCSNSLSTLVFVISGDFKDFTEDPVKLCLMLPIRCV